MDLRRVRSLLVLGMVVLASSLTEGCSSATETDWTCNFVSNLLLEFPEINVSGCSEVTPSNKTLFALQPRVLYLDASPGVPYTIVMVDPDAPNHVGCTSYLHWIQYGSQGDDLISGNLQSGTIVAGYVSPAPPAKLGPHRYFVYVYECPEPLLPQDPITKRTQFSLQQYVEANGLKGPLASAMFVTEF